MEGDVNGATLARANEDSVAGAQVAEISAVAVHRVGTQLDLGSVGSDGDLFAVDRPCAHGLRRAVGPTSLAAPSLIAETMRARNVRASSRASFSQPRPPAARRSGLLVGFHRRGGSASRPVSEVGGV